MGKMSKMGNGDGESSPAAAAASRRWTSAEIKEFADGFMEERMSRFSIPGAGLAVVADGQVLFTGSYGWADLDRREPVSVQETVWPVASVSKLFTATAAMRLVEEGKLDLDRDYRDVVPGLACCVHGPVTLRGLLTHTAGLEEDNFGMVRPGVGPLVPLEDYLRRCRLRQRRPPGQRIHYCNHGMVVVGRLIEWASGMRYEDYVRQAILEPLGMHRSGFAWDEDLLSHLAKGYEAVGNGWRAIPTDTILATPSGGLKASVADMSKFLLLHTGDGSVGGRRILRAETLATMQRPHFRFAPQAAGMALGFWERRQNGLEGVEHGGAIRGYSCLLTVWPAERLGVFVIANCQQVAFGEEFVSAFLERFYPIIGHTSEDHNEPARANADRSNPHGESEADGNAAGGSSGHKLAKTAGLTVEPMVPLERFAGTYYLERYRPESLEKLHGLFAELEVRLCGDGELEIRFPLDTLPAWRIRRESATLFREVRGGRPVVFLLDEAGWPVHVAVNAVLCGERARWYERSTTHLAVASGLLVGWLIGLGRTVRHVGKWRRRSENALQERGWQVWYAIYCGVGLAWMLGLVGVLVGVDSWRFTYGVPWWLRAGLALPLLAMVAFLVASVKLFRGSDKSARWRRWLWLADTLVVLVWLVEIAYWRLWPWG
jgi:CubicO group peptidase (beta-lactamase class C family)